MVISFRGYVLAFGRPQVRVADSMITLNAAKKALIADGYSGESADKYINLCAKHVLESENE